MPGSTEEEAIQNYSAPISQTLSCITDVPLAIGDVRGKTALAFVGTPPIARIHGTQFDLYFAQSFSVVQREDGWKVQTEGYVYRIQTGTHPYVQYHWHPVGDYLKKRPHLHLNAQSGVLKQGLNKIHFPTGRMSIEELVRFLIEDIHASPLREDWNDILRANLDRFERYRSWA